MGRLAWAQHTTTQFLPCGSTSRRAEQDEARDGSARQVGSSGRLGESSSPGARGSGAAARRPGRGLMASPFLPLAAWITSGRPLPFPRGSEQSRSTANGCGNTSPTRLLTGDAPERRMVADRFQSICSMVNTVNKRPGSGTPRERQPSEQICAWAPSQRIEARRPPMTRMSLASYRRAELGASVLRFQRSRLQALESTGSIRAAGTGAHALQASSSSAEMASAPFTHGPGGTSSGPTLRNQPISGFQLAMVEDEHRRLKALAAELTLDKHMWSEALRKTG